MSDQTINNLTLNGSLNSGLNNSSNHTLMGKTFYIGHNPNSAASTDTLYIYNQNLQLINGGGTTLTMNSTGITIAGGQFAAPGVEIQQNQAYYTKPSIFQNTLLAEGEFVVINQNLSVGGTAALFDISLNANTFIAGDLSLNGRLFMNDDTIPASAIIGDVGGGSNLIEYMTNSIYNDTGNTYNNKLYVAYAQINNGNKLVYYMSKIRKPDTNNDYEWHYTTVNPIGSDTLTIFDDWSPVIPVPVISSYSTANYSEGQTGISNSPVVSSSPTSYNISLNKSNTSTTITQDIGLTFNTTNGIISGTITQSTAGTYRYDITATNSGGTSNPYEITITIVDDVASPVFNYNNTTFNYTTLSPGETLNPTINVTSTWSISPEFPNYISLNTSNGNITVNPQSGITHNGTHTIRATNNDTPAEYSEVNLTFNITLALPQITGYTSTTLVEGQTVTLNPQGSYLSNASNTFSISTNTNNNNQTITDELGLTFNTTTGVISGTVNQQIEGTYNYTVSHSNSEGNGNDFTLTITVQDDVAPPNINYSTSSYEFINGTTQTIQAPTNTGGAISSWSMDSETPLLYGLSLNTSTGVISGTIPVMTTVTEYYTVVASNTDNETSSATITITFKQPVPVIWSYANLNFSEGQQNAMASPWTSNSASSYNISLNKSPGNDNTINQDTGLIFNTTTGVISGNITQSTAGTYKYDVTATNTGGTSNPYEITITIVDDIATPVIDYGSLTRNYTTLSNQETITPSINVSVTWSIDKAFPNYITFNSSNGEIIVDPQSTITYSDTHTITATNNDTPPESDSKTLTFNITLATPQITGYSSVSNNAINVTEGSTYTLTPSGSYLTGYGNNYTITTNDIGLTINPNNGVISGTITQNKAGSYNYTVSHSNSEGNGNDFTISVTVVDDIPDPTISYSASTYTGTVGESINIPAPTKTNVNTLSISPSLPDGLTLNADGSISGTPTTVSDDTYTITATNSDTPTESVNATITITISAAAVDYPGINSVTYMPSDHTTGINNYNYGQVFIGLTTDDSIMFTIKLNNPINNQDIWYNIACNSLSSMDHAIQTDLTYSNTSTTLHYLPTSYLSDVNTTMPYNAGALFLTNAANNSKYIIAKIPNPAWNPSYYIGGVDYNQQQGTNKFIYRFVQNGTASLENPPGAGYDTTYTYTSNTGCIPPLPANYNDTSVKNGWDNGQLFIGRYGDGLYLIIFINNEYKQISLSIRDPNLPALNYETGNAATYNSNTHWIYPPS
jgi:hypothetical protein